MDTKEILAILKEFTATGLEELKYKEGSVELFLKRHPEVTYSGSPAYAPAPAAHSPAPTHSAPSSAPSAAPAKETSGDVITSPIVGTVYRSAAPDSPSFVEEGKSIKKGETLCIIEAMKVMNELEAEFDCEVIRVMVDNGAFVEYGTPLFEVRRK